MYNRYASTSHSEELQRLENETLKAQVSALQFQVQHNSNNKDDITMMNNNNTLSSNSRSGSATNITTTPPPQISSSSIYEGGVRSSISKGAPIFNQQQQQQPQPQHHSAISALRSGNSLPQQTYPNNTNTNYYSPSPSSASQHQHQHQQQYVAALSNNSGGLASASSVLTHISNAESIQNQERNARLVVFLSESSDRLEVLRRFSSGAVDAACFEADRRISLISKYKERIGDETESERLRQSMIRMEAELHEAASFVNQLHGQLARSQQERSDIATDNTKLQQRLTEALALRSSEERLRIHDEEKSRSEISELKARMVELKEDNERLRRHERQMIEDMGDATNKIEEYSQALDEQRRTACTSDCTDAKEHRDVLVRENAKMKEQLQQLEVKLRRSLEESVPLLVHKQEISVLRAEVESRDRLLAALQQRNTNAVASEELSSRLQMQLEQERAVIVQLQAQIQEERSNHAAEIIEWRSRENQWQVAKASLEAELEATHARLEGSRQDYARAIASLQAQGNVSNGNEFEREEVAAKLLIAAKEIENLTSEKKALQEMLMQYRR